MPEILSCFGPPQNSAEGIERSVDRAVAKRTAAVHQEIKRLDKHDTFAFQKIMRDIPAGAGRLQRSAILDSIARHSHSPVYLADALARYQKVTPHEPAAQIHAPETQNTEELQKYREDLSAEKIGKNAEHIPLRERDQDVFDFIHRSPQYFTQPKRFQVFLEAVERHVAPANGVATPETPAFSVAQLQLIRSIANNYRK